MAVPVYQVADQQTFSGVTALNTNVDYSISKPTNLAAGDLVLLFLHCEMSHDLTTSNFTIPAGFTLIRSDRAVSVGTTYVPESLLCYKVAGASEPATYTYNHKANVQTNTRSRAACGRVTGVNTADIVEASSGTTSGSTGVSSLTLPTLTVAADNLLIATVSVYNGTTETITQPSGMTLAYSAQTTAAAGALSHQDFASAGSTGTKQYTWSPNTRRAAGTIIALNGAASVRYIPDVEPLYYGAQLMASKTAIEFKVTAGHDNLAGALLGSGTNGTTDSLGNFVLPAGVTLSDQGEPVAANDPVTLHLYWTEGSDPVVDRSIIVKTTLVAEA